MSDSVRPCLTFVDRAEEAVKFYVSVFPNSRITNITRVEQDGGPIPKGKLLNATFELDGREFLAFDGGPSFSFTEGISLMVNCKTQEEVDRYWSMLTEKGGEEGPCGWLKDRFGISWQVVPEQLGQMLSDPASGNSEAAMQAMLKMRKLDIAALQRAYRGVAV
jgi:predicted 3-demethylubiquinone-9 3-methyltransferase (glyoxalase superfamily)